MLFLDADAKLMGKRRRILAAPPLFTMEKGVAGINSEAGRGGKETTDADFGISEAGMAANGADFYTQLCGG